MHVHVHVRVCRDMEGHTCASRRFRHVELTGAIGIPLQARCGILQLKYIHTFIPTQKERILCEPRPNHTPNVDTGELAVLSFVLV